MVRIYFAQNLLTKVLTLPSFHPQPLCRNTLALPYCPSLVTSCFTLYRMKVTIPCAVHTTLGFVFKNRSAVILLLTTSESTSPSCHV